MEMSECVDHGKRRHAAGYAYVRHSGKRVRLHRLIYCQKAGVALEDIDGLVVRHTCDNAWCINPEHLIIGTQADNIRDAVERGRNAKGSSNGQSNLTPEAVMYCREHYVAYHPEFGEAALARRFGVGCSVVHDAIKGKTWRGV